MGSKAVTLLADDNAAARRQKLNDARAQRFVESQGAHAEHAYLHLARRCPSSVNSTSSPGDGVRALASIGEASVSVHAGTWTRCWNASVIGFSTAHGREHSRTRLEAVCSRAPSESKIRTSTPKAATQPEAPRDHHQFLTTL